MNSSDEINKLAEALAKAQGEMEGARKAQLATVTTKTGGKYTYNYATMESIVDAVRAPFAANGLSFTQLPVYTESNEVRVETVLLHISGQWIASELRIPVAVADAQGFGSAFTYACKYGLRAIAGVPAIDAEDDDGAAAVKAKPKATEAEMMPAPKRPEEYAPTPVSSPVSQLPGMQPHPNRVTFTIGKANYSTAGMTKEQMESSFKLVSEVNTKLGKGTAEGMLRSEFKVVSRTDLTKDDADKYLIRLSEMLSTD